MVLNMAVSSQRDYADWMHPAPWTMARKLAHRIAKILVGHQNPDLASVSPASSLKRRLRRRQSLFAVEHCANAAGVEYCWPVRLDCWRMTRKPIKASFDASIQVSVIGEIVGPTCQFVICILKLMDS